MPLNFINLASLSFNVVLLLIFKNLMYFFIDHSVPILPYTVCAFYLLTQVFILVTFPPLFCCSICSDLVFRNANYASTGSLLLIFHNYQIFTIMFISLFFSILFHCFHFCSFSFGWFQSGFPAFLFLRPAIHFFPLLLFYNSLFLLLNLTFEYFFILKRDNFVISLMWWRIIC